MASGDARPVPRKNIAFRVTFPILDADGDLVTGAASLDSEVSIDGGTFADVTAEATEIATASGMYFLDLTAAEMNGDTIAIIVKTSTAGAKTTPIVLYPEEIGDYRADVQQWLGTAPATPTVAGVPEVDVTHVGGTVQTAGDIIGDTNDIQARLPAALVGGRVDASVGAMAAGVVTAAAVATGAIDADALAADAATEIRSLANGTADSGTTTTMVDAARTEADTDYWKGCIILFTSGSLLGQARLITGFTPASDTITFAPATTQAVGTHTYEILPAGRADVHLWAGDVANLLVAGRVDASVGAMAAGVVTAAAVATGAIDADALAADAVAEVADGVWDEDATGHQTTGTYGQAIGDPVADTNTIYGAVVTGAAGATIAADIITVQADTDNMQTRLPAALVGGRMDSSVGAMAADVVTAAAVANGAIDAATFAAGAIDAAAIANGAIDAATFAAGAIDAAAIAADAIGASELAADAVTEIRDSVWAQALTEATAVPSITGTMKAALEWLFMLGRNRITQTATTQLVRNDADAATVGTSTVSDDGTTFVRGKFV